MERNTTEKQTAIRIICSTNSQSSMISLGLWMRVRRERENEGWLVQQLQPLRLNYRNQRVLNRDPAVLAKLAKRACDRFTGRTGHRSHLLVCQQQRKAEPTSVEGFSDLM